MNTLSISDNQIDLRSLIEPYMQNNSNDPKKKLREIFKDFYKTTEFQQFLAQKDRQKNPWKRWVHDNQPACETFREVFTKRLAKTMRDGYGVDASKLTSLESK